jgi:recombination protein RecT
MSGAAIQKDPKQKVASLMTVLEARKTTFQTLLPGGLKAEWFLAEVKVAAARAPKLADCSTLSIVDALTTCAQLGLSPSGRLGSAYLIPYKDKCTLVIGYRGYVDLAYRSGDVASFHAEVVHDKDVFTHREGLAPVLEHIRTEENEPGQLRAVYAIARMKDGSVSHVVMLRREVLAIKARSRASSDGPWVTDEAEMWKKTAIRRLIKLIPLSPTRAKDLRRAEEAERDQEDALDVDFSVEEAPKSGVSGAKERAKAALQEHNGAWAADPAEMAAASARQKVTADLLNGEPPEEEKVAILKTEMESSEG